MLPPFDSEGNLPPGIHPCRFAELVERFGKGSPEREVEIQELERFLEWASRAGIRRLVINGSFVTVKEAPNDVDVVILPGPGYPGDQAPADEVNMLWPFLQVFVAADDADLENWAIADFGTDRDGRPKGVVEITL